MNLGVFSLLVKAHHTRRIGPPCHSANGLGKAPETRPHTHHEYGPAHRLRHPLPTPFNPSLTIQTQQFHFVRQGFCTKRTEHIRNPCLPSPSSAKSRLGVSGPRSKPPNPKKEKVAMNPSFRKVERRPLAILADAPTATLAQGAVPNTKQIREHVG